MLTAENISKTYQLSKGNATTALSKVSLSFPDRGLVAITGKSGCGKTTLLNILSGVDQPTTGEVKFGGGGNYASFIFQDAQLIDDFTVEENLRLIKRILPETEGDFEKLLADFGLSEVRAHKSNQLSAGQKQRVAIVRAILQNRPVLFADEPTGNLDEKTSGEIAAALASRAKERLVIVVTHDYEYFAPYASRKIVMSDGKITQDETLDTAAETVNRGEVGNQKPPVFKWTTAARFAVKGFKKAPVRLALSLVSLFLSLLLALSGLNVLLNDDGAVRYNAFKDAGLATADFGKAGRIKNWGIFEDITNGEFNDLQKKFEAVKYVDTYLDVESRIYLSGECFLPLLHGKREIGPGEMAVSDCLAERIAKDRGLVSVSDIIGTTFYELLVCGIFETNAPDSLNDFPKIESQMFNSCIMSESTYNQRYQNDDYHCATTLDWINIEFLQVVKDPSKYQYFAGKPFDELGEKEIAVTPKFVEEILGGTVEDWLGKEIDLSFLKMLRLGHFTFDDVVDSQTYTLKIGTVFNTSFSGSNLFNVSIPPPIFDSLFPYYDSMGPGYGVSLTDYSKSDVRQMYKLGYRDNTYLAETIDEGQDWVSTLSYVMLVVALVLMIISIITLVNFVGALLSRSKREMGVLMAFGVKKSGIAKIFLLSSVGLVLAAVLLAALAHFAVVAAVNGIMLHFEITLIQYLHYEPLSLLTIIGLMAIIIGIMTAAILAGFRKKSPIDVIYER